MITMSCRHARLLLIAALSIALGATSRAQHFAEARIFIEYNSTDNDLGFHVFLDGEDWRSLSIVNPNGATIAQVAGQGPFRDLGMTELFFEGAEPSLDEVPLNQLLALFPEGTYTFSGVTVHGIRLTSRWRFTLAVPAPVPVSATVAGNTVTISWQTVAGPPAGFPSRAVTIVGYQVIVGSFQVTLPASSRQVTLPEEFVNSLGAGVHGFEVLAIEQRANQTITSGSFTIP